LVDDPLDNLRRITDRLSQYGCPLIMNTIYDPTEGSDTLGQQIGLSTGYRSAFDDLNEGIRETARAKGLLLSDLHKLFAGHGISSPQTWIVAGIEPNHAGATAIAAHWFQMYSSAKENRG